MSRSQINLQDAFLNHVRKEKIPVTINIAGGGKIEGLVKGFDNFVILVKHDGQHLIYKHAINTIVPERAVELSGHSAATHAETEAKLPATETETTATAPAESEEPWVEG
ncbi:MAG TPA: RNA chaperone Hfq [Nitrospirota bacterium]|nr:RNA chaperone Hfq [Nitrospirota bacterium]